MNKRIALFLSLALIFSAGIFGFAMKQDKPSPPKSTNGTIGNTEIIVKYGAPSVRDRTVWGELVPYNQVWRTGANEATTIETKSDIMIQGKKLPAGTYSLFTIPKENSDWIVIFNEVDKQWGAFDYDSGRDVMRVMATPQSTDFNEQMMFKVEPGDGNEGRVVLYWDELMVPIEIETMEDK